MFDVYQHKKQRQYRTIVPKDAPFPAKGEPTNWRKVKAVQESQLWPEAMEAITKHGYYCYQPKVSFEEIEAAGSSPAKRKK